MNTLPTTTTLVLPTTLDGLITFLAVDPDAFGVRGAELLARLLDVRDDPGGKDAAERLARDIERWVADGELDANMGTLAIQILGVSPDGGPPGGWKHGDGD